MNQQEKINRIKTDGIFFDCTYINTIEVYIRDMIYSIKLYRANEKKIYADCKEFDCLGLGKNIKDAVNDFIDNATKELNFKKPIEIKGIDSEKALEKVTNNK